MKNNTSKLFVTVGAAFALIFGVFMATPTQAHAFQLGQLIDPGCFFACNNGGGRTVKNITNYGNYQSPGGTVVNGNVSGAYGYNVPSSGATYNNYTYSSNYSAAPVVTSPTYSYYSNQPIAYAPQSYPAYQPVYTQPAYAPLYVSCSANSDYGTVGSPVTWTAYASGGSGYYTYTWSGTDGLYGNGQSIYFTYQVPGYKTASVTVYSNGQTFTENCGNGISIGGGYYAQPIVAQPVPVYGTPVPRSTNYNGLDIGCYADPVTATPNQPVTWNVEVTGGVGPYTYSWTGTDGLSGAAASVIKYYSTAGTKSAVVTVTSADGNSSVHACSNTITVRSGSAPVKKPVTKPVDTTTTSNNGLSAAALFSLSSIPWGWVSVLVILVLFATVVYLLFNKPKI